MRVLVVCTKRGYVSQDIPIAPFILEQAHSLNEFGVDCDFYLINRGVKGYLKAIKEIRKVSSAKNPDIIHAHYGICGFIANLQRKIPVVTTYHGSDLNDRFVRIISLISALFSKRNIVVSEELKGKLFKSYRNRVIPCSVNSSLFVPMEKNIARSNLGWNSSGVSVLFSKEFYNKVKNYPLARAAVDIYNSKKDSSQRAQLLEFVNYTREQVLWLYNSVDCVIMTSHHEGSPQFIKEAMACNCPIVSVDVGDVKQVIAGVEGCYLAERNPEDLARKLDAAIKHGKTNGRSKVLQEYDSTIIAQRILSVYKEIQKYE